MMERGETDLFRLGPLLPGVLTMVPSSVTVTWASTAGALTAWSFSLRVLSFSPFRFRMVLELTPVKSAASSETRFHDFSGLRFDRRENTFKII